MSNLLRSFNMPGKPNIRIVTVNKNPKGFSEKLVQGDGTMEIRVANDPKSIDTTSGPAIGTAMPKNKPVSVAKTA